MYFNLIFYFCIFDDDFICIIVLNFILVYFSVPLFKCIGFNVCKISPLINVSFNRLDTVLLSIFPSFFSILKQYSNSIQSNYLSFIDVSIIHCWLTHNHCINKCLKKLFYFNLFIFSKPGVTPYQHC